jgi:hypothetical protein
MARPPPSLDPDEDLDMRWTLALALPLLPAGSLAQEGAVAPAPAQTTPVITVGGQAFATWQEYVTSPVFRQLQLRCGTRVEPVTELRPASDCTIGSTTIQPEYEPVGGMLYRIPIVVHVIQGNGGAGDVSDALIHSQIDVINEDFQALAGTLGENGTDARVEFFLATTDPLGNPTTGITRTTNATWFADQGNYYDTLSWDPERYVNVYTNEASGALGYVPNLPQGGIVGASFDRVVVLWSAFGRNAPIGPPFHLGRTLTHELGHYFGLHHTFSGGCGTASCYTTGDLICDTGSESGPVFGCPASSNSCGTPDPFHNYMDYSDDDCYEEFTPEQVNRMRCTLENWRVDLHEPGVCTTAAAAVTRTDGLNLAVYTATPPVLGGSVAVSIVDPTHTSAILLAYSGAVTKALPNGYVFLVDYNTPRLFRIALPLPPGATNLGVPNDVGLCGITAYTQAVLLGGGGGGFALSNAVDLTAGI